MVAAVCPLQCTHPMICCEKIWPQPLPVAHQTERIHKSWVDFEQLHQLSAIWLVKIRKFIEPPLWLCKSYRSIHKIVLRCIKVALFRFYWKRSVQRIKSYKKLQPDAYRIYVSWLCVRRNSKSSEKYELLLLFSYKSRQNIFIEIKIAQSVMLNITELCRQYRVM